MEQKASATLAKTKILPVHSACHWSENENGVLRACAVSAIALELIPKSNIESVENSIIRLKNNKIVGMSDIVHDELGIPHDIIKKISDKFIGVHGNVYYGTNKRIPRTRQNLFKPVVKYIESLGY